MNQKTRKAVINQLTLQSLPEPYLDILEEQAQETKPSRTIRALKDTKKREHNRKDRRRDWDD